HMAGAFYGRVAAYDRALAKGEAGEALKRNLFGTASPTPTQVEAMAGYLERAAAALAGQPVSEVLAGRPQFGDFEGKP
ncbi:MAG TPA: ubiquinol-cytochrome C chaperone family protein, partial [Dongiaceae bacterium]|nr:ubiquinol-cytochrome C chaperone family protein [Dongiaceae bacterium]